MTNKTIREQVVEELAFDPTGSELPVCRPFRQHGGTAYAPDVTALPGFAVWAADDRAGANTRWLALLREEQHRYDMLRKTVLDDDWQQVISACEGAAVNIVTRLSQQCSLRELNTLIAQAGEVTTELRCAQRACRAWLTEGPPSAEDTYCALVRVSLWGSWDATK